MSKLYILASLLFMTSLFAANQPSSEPSKSNDTEKLPQYGSGLPRELDTLAPAQGSYPHWRNDNYQTVNAKRLQQVVSDLSQFALADKKLNKFWGRLPGTEADRNTMEYISTELQSLGYKLEHRKAVIPEEWKPQDWQLSIHLQDKVITLDSAFPSGAGLRKSTALKSDAVWLGLGSEADFKGRVITDKVAVIYSMFVPGGRSHSASNRSKLFYANKRAAERGARLIINIMGVPGDGQFMPAPHYLTRGKVIAPLPIPVVSISQDQGFALRDMLASDEVTMSYKVEVEKQINLEASYLIAELPGKSQEEILIAAHTDGYFQGALDNASGVAVALEMAHYYALQTEPPERTIKLFFFSDHHHGEFTRREFEEAYDWSSTALVITVEHPSQTQLYWYNDGLMTANAIGAFRWNVNGSSTLNNLVLSKLREAGVSTYTVMDKNPKFTKQAPSFHIIDHVIYHTTLDTPELVPTEGLVRATKAFLNVIAEVNKLKITALR